MKTPVHPKCCFPFSARLRFRVGAGFLIFLLTACRTASSADIELADAPPLPVTPPPPPMRAMRPAAAPDSPQSATLAQESQLLLLTNAQAVVGMSPRLAGRIMLYRLSDGPNALKSDPAHWSAQPEDVPEVTLESQFKPFHGHIVWLGPQKDWWVQQDLDESRRELAPAWPPDPYLMYSPFRVVTQRVDYVRLEGPASPVSGMRLLKEVTLKPDGSVRVKVTGTNMRQEPVSWDLWSNTRLPGRARCYVPGEGSSRLRLDWSSDRPLAARMLDHAIVGPFFTFRSEVTLAQGVARRMARAFVTPQRGMMAGFYGGQVFIKRVPCPDPATVHPDQATIEIHQQIAPDRGNCLLELANHGPYAPIEPGESIALEEEWSLHRYDGPATCTAEVGFLEQVLARLKPLDLEPAARPPAVLLP